MLLRFTSIAAFLLTAALALSGCGPSNGGTQQGVAFFTTECSRDPFSLQQAACLPNSE